METLEDNSRSTWKQRAMLVLACGIFTGCFQQIYLDWLYPVFGYYGFENSAPSGRYVALAWLFSVTPAFWMPIRLTRPSQLIYWLLYLTVFIPSMFVPLYVGLQPPNDVATMMLALFAGFAITGISYFFPLLRFHPPSLSPQTCKWFFICFASGLVLWVVTVFRGNFHIVSFADVYDVRSAADDVMEGSSVNYALMWMSAVVGPFLMTWAIVRKRKLAFLAGALIQVLVYSSTGAKSVIISIIAIPVAAFLLRDGGTSFGLKVAWTCTISSVLLYWGRPSGQTESLAFWVFSLVYMRVFGTSGLNTAWYQDFFLRNPVTHYSHIKVINWLITYPYANPLGIEVGAFYSGDPTLDANAHFWATDGLAAWGLWGVLLVSVACALVFWTLDSAAKGHELRFTAVLVCFEALNLCNVSLFTSLLSGGLGLLMLLLYLAPRRGAEAIDPGHATAPLVPVVQS